MLYTTLLLLLLLLLLYYCYTLPYNTTLPYREPHLPGATWLLKPSLAFDASTDPVDTSAQAALAPHQTTETKESADTTFMAM
jgi:hypothetical protein